MPLVPLFWQIWFLILTNGTKKARELYQLLVPHLEALALPDIDRTSNARAHADMDITSPIIKMAL